MRSPLNMRLFRTWLFIRRRSSRISCHEAQKCRLSQALIGEHEIAFLRLSLLTPSLIPLCDPPLPLHPPPFPPHLFAIFLSLPSIVFPEGSAGRTFFSFFFSFFKLGAAALTRAIHTPAGCRRSPVALLPTHNPRPLPHTYFLTHLPPATKISNPPCPACSFSSPPQHPPRHPTG